MKLLIDMNLSPSFTEILNNEGFDTVHWSTIGNPRSTDAEILNYARSNGFVIITHDLDFGDILAATQAQSPSVIQIRTQNVSLEHLSNILINSLKQFEKKLEKGALVSIDEARSRVRILPIKEID